MRVPPRCDGNSTATALRQPRSPTPGAARRARPAPRRPRRGSGARVAGGAAAAGGRGGGAAAVVGPRGPPFAVGPPPTVGAGALLLWRAANRCLGGPDSFEPVFENFAANI